MTWEQLLKILMNMAEVGHSSMEKKVHIIVDGSIYEMDIFESVHTGDAHIGPMLNEEEDDADQE